MSLVGLETLVTGKGRYCECRVIGVMLDIVLESPLDVVLQGGKSCITIPS
jgi:hypothetical protein